MTLLAPAALLFAALAIPLIGVYMLRARRHRHEVSSTMLWEAEVESVSAARPWQRLPLSWPLLVQLLILAMFVLILARPFTTQEAELGAHTVFIMDTSGSMAMAGRLERAQADAAEIIGRASASNIVSVIDAGTAPTVTLSFSAQADEALAAIRALQPGGGEEDLDAAIRAGRALATPDRPTTLLIFSDGGNPDTTAWDSTIADTRHFLYDQIEDNVAISSFALDVIPGEGVLVFVEVTNHTLAPREVEGVVTVDGVVTRTFRVDTQAGGRGRDSLEVDANAGSVVEGWLIDDSGDDLTDGLMLDNRAVAVAPASGDLAVRVEGESSIFLDALLQSTPGVSVADTADVVVADRVLPIGFERPTWLIRPPAPPSGLEMTGVVQNVAVSFQRPGEPILDAVDLSEVVVGEAQIVDGPGWVPIVSARDVPLILLGEIDGVRAVYTTFDLTHSNLPVQIGFPVIGSRIMRWLAGDDVAGAASAEAGAPIVLTGSSTETPIVVRPDGAVATLAAGSLLYSETEAPGLYSTRYRTDDGSERVGQPEVRSFAPGESLGASQALPAVAPAPSSAAAGSIIRELAPPLLVLLALLFAVEWLATHRRARSAAPASDDRVLVEAGRR